MLYLVVCGNLTALINYLLYEWFMHEWFTTRNFHWCIEESILRQTRDLVFIFTLNYLDLCCLKSGESQISQDLGDTSQKKHKGKTIGQIFSLSHSLWANQIQSLPVVLDENSAVPQSSISFFFLNNWIQLYKSSDEFNYILSVRILPSVTSREDYFQCHVFWHRVSETCI